MKINICKAIKQHTKEDSQTMVINFPIKTYDLKQNTKLYTIYIYMSLNIYKRDILLNGNNTAGSVRFKWMNNNTV